MSGGAMNAERLLQVYEQISEAPDAIAQLRRFVLDLAVRGKLVEQDAADEPASELISRLSAGKEQLVLTKVIKKPRVLGNDDELVRPYDIPVSWQWCRLDSVGAIVGGGTPSAADSSNFETPGSGVPWLTPADLGGHAHSYISRGARDLSEKGLSSSSATLMPTGAVLFTSRAPIGYVAIAENPISTNQGFKSVVPFLSDCSRYIALTLKALATEIDAKASGTTFKEVSGKIVAGIPFPLPPLAEQHRIVAKVDELMALCDRLEEARKTREELRDKLTAASLARLTAPETTAQAEPTKVGTGFASGSATSQYVSGKVGTGFPSDTAHTEDDFPAHARFALEALPSLTTRPDQIKTLRQTILNLAVRGKLVEQDPAAEPASALLEKIAQTKSEEIRSGKRKIDRPLGEFKLADMPTIQPCGWAFDFLQNVIDVRDGTHDTPAASEEANAIPLVTSKDFKAGEIDFQNAKRISLADHIEISKRSAVDVGDILFSMIGGNIGNQVMVNDPRPFSIKNVALFKYYDTASTLPRFIKIYMEDLANRLQNEASGGAQPFVSLGALRKLPIGLPPLAEQHRIVAKVDALMALCDRLEAALTTADTTRTRLLEALLHEALESTNDSLEAAE
ncbi:restriction endonuclease subunit S [Pseudoruegeria sp. SHC-113]|uniref:restriction endonuclease subunit S n=1 Tax=Pseudoruegeria sp. SHC-113 TaxID=2855439 RepID=UPI0021BA7C57|nr:restriction endonuclease subunit S [Pseudoruegeria sp. SHC-113]MCT8160001.1 restriction endonuclease subunit S [Pseudoruegeria sp. SHC-113]